jgi:hypothetical protein
MIIIVSINMHALLFIASEMNLNMIYMASLPIAKPSIHEK